MSHALKVGSVSDRAIMQSHKAEHRSRIATRAAVTVAPVSVQHSSTVPENTGKGSTDWTHTCEEDMVGGAVYLGGLSKFVRLIIVLVYPCLSGSVAVAAILMAIL